LELDREKYHRIKEISPWRIFYILLAVNGFLGIFVLIFPNGERWLGENIRLQFTSSTDLFEPRNTVIVNLDSVLGDIDLNDTSNYDNDVVAELDSAIKMPELNKRIQYKSGVAGGLNHFFEALYTLEKGDSQLFRILHYGDSQLEGDRISDYLRNKLQLRFGGSGPGIILPIDVSRSRVSIRQSESSDWRKYAIYGKRRHPQGIYGIGGASFVYTGTVAVKVGEDTIITKVYDSLVPQKTVQPLLVNDTGLKHKQKDTISQEIAMVPFDSAKFSWDTVVKNRYVSKVTESSWLRFRCAEKSYPKVRTFNKVELLYASSDTTRLKIEIDGRSIQKVLYPTPNAKKITLYDGLVSQEVKLNFSGPSPIVLGVFLDGHKGVAVDNFPMRGSSGTGYEIIKSNLLTQQLQLSNVRLIVMQYGINVVPNPTNNYGFYERMFLSQLKAIKSAAPEVDILVIGPSDMSRKVGGEYVSYPNITKIRNAMRNAAFATDCAFWDLYETMGGENSMVSWVQNDPSLASKDFTHFNARGARHVGEMLYDALLSEYLVWKRNQTKAMTSKVVPAV